MEKQPNSLEALQKRQARLVIAEGKARNVADSTRQFLFEGKLPENPGFTPTENLNFPEKEGLAKINAQVSLADIVERVSEQTIPAIQKKQRVIDTEINEYLAIQQLNIEKIQERVTKGLLPQSVLDEAVALLQTIVNPTSEVPTPTIKLPTGPSADLQPTPTGKSKPKREEVEIAPGITLSLAGLKADLARELNNLAPGEHITLSELAIRHLDGDSSASRKKISARLSELKEIYGENGYAIQSITDSKNQHGLYIVKIGTENPAPEPNPTEFQTLLPDGTAVTSTNKNAIIALSELIKRIHDGTSREIPHKSLLAILQLPDTQAGMNELGKTIYDISMTLMESSLNVRTKKKKLNGEITYTYSLEKTKEDPTQDSRIDALTLLIKGDASFDSLRSVLGPNKKGKDLTNQNIIWALVGASKLVSRRVSKGFELTPKEEEFVKLLGEYNTTIFITLLPKINELKLGTTAIVATPLPDAPTELLLNTNILEDNEDEDIAVPEEQDISQEDIAIVKSWIRGRVGTRIEFQNGEGFIFKLTPELEKLMKDLPPIEKIQGDLKQKRKQATDKFSKTYNRYLSDQSYAHPNPDVDTLIYALSILNDQMGGYLQRFLEAQLKSLEDIGALELPRYDRHRYPHTIHVWHAPTAMQEAIQKRHPEIEKPTASDTKIPVESTRKKAVTPASIPTGIKPLSQLLDKHRGSQQRYPHLPIDSNRWLAEVQTNPQGRLLVEPTRNTLARIPTSVKPLKPQEVPRDTKKETPEEYSLDTTLTKNPVKPELLKALNHLIATSGNKEELIDIAWGFQQRYPHLPIDSNRWLAEVQTRLHGRLLTAQEINEEFGIEEDYVLRPDPSKKKDAFFEDTRFGALDIIVAQRKRHADTIKRELSINDARILRNYLKLIQEELKLRGVSYYQQTDVMPHIATARVSAILEDGFKHAKDSFRQQVDRANSTPSAPEEEIDTQSIVEKHMGIDTSAPLEPNTETDVALEALKLELSAEADILETQINATYATPIHTLMETEIPVFEERVEESEIEEVVVVDLAEQIPTRPQLLPEEKPVTEKPKEKLLERVKDADILIKTLVDEALAALPALKITSDSDEEKRVPAGALTATQLFTFIAKKETFEYLKKRGFIEPTLSKTKIPQLDLVDVVCAAFVGKLEKGMNLQPPHIKSLRSMVRTEITNRKNQLVKRK